MPSFLVLLFIYVLSQFYRSFLAVIASDLARDIGVDTAALGTISAAWFVAFALAQFGVGFALDRLGPRWTLSGLTLFAVAGAGWLSAATSFAGCVAAMSLIGIGCAPALMASMYLFARTQPPHRFALLSSTLIGLGSVGNILCATPLALAAAAFGWRASILMIAGLTVVGALFAALALRDPPRLAAEGGQGALLAGLARVARIRALWPIIPIVCLSYAVVIASRSLWIAPFLRDTHGLDPTGIGNAALAMSVAMSVGALLFGPAERLFGAKPTVLAGTTVCVAAFLTLGLLGERSLPLAVALFTLIGLSGGTYAILMAHARDFIPPALLGRGVTFLNVGFIGGAGLLQWGSGIFVRASEAAGLAAPAIFERLHLAYGVMLGAAVAVYVLAPRAAAEPARA